MPRLSSTGNVAMGVGGHQGVINGAFIPDSYGPMWMNHNTAVFIQPSNSQVTVYDISNGNRTPQIIRPANDLRAGGNVWALWADHFGLQASTGFYLRFAGLLDVGPNGEVGYVVDRQNGWGANVHELNGEDWVLATDQVVYDLQLLGARRAIYNNHQQLIKTVNLPPCIQIGGCWRPRAVQIAGEWWVCYFSGDAGVIFHPFNSTMGYVITPPNVNAYQHDAVQLGDITKIVWAARAGEAPEDYRERLINVFTEPRVQLRPDVQIPIIGKPCWVSWFEFNRPPTVNPPGNSLLPIRWPDQSGTILKLDRTRFGSWIDGATVEEIEQKAGMSLYPPLAYWDSRNWPRWPNLPANAWLGLQAYCFNNEQPNVFESNMRAIINSVPAHYEHIALICQCYTSNASLTNNLIGLVPVYAALARDYPRINFLGVFSDQDRATGLNDHPELRPYWQRLFNGVTGEPPMADDTEIVAANNYGIQRWAELRVNEISAQMIQQGQDAKPFQRKMFVQVMQELHWEKGYRWVELFWKGGFGNIDHIGEDTFIMRLDSNTVKWCDAVGNMGLPISTWDSRFPVNDPNPPSDEELCAPPPPLNQPGNIGVTIYRYTNPARRSDPLGCVIQFEVAADFPVVEIRIEINDGDLPFVWKREPGTKDGRYFRVFGVKVTVNGEWVLTVSGKDEHGNEASHSVPLTVDF